MSKRKQKIHSAGIMAEAVSEITKGKSTYSVSKEYGIPQSTMKDHSHGKYKGCKTGFGRHTKLDGLMSKSLVNYILYMAERRFPLSRKQIKVIAREDMTVTFRSPQPEPSKKWLRNILRRHKELAIRTPHPLCKARAALSQETITAYFNLLNKTIQSLGINEPSQIYHVDKTGFSGKLSANAKVVVRKGVRQAFKMGVCINEHITVNFVISANEVTIPPMFIFIKSLPRCMF